MSKLFARAVLAVVLQISCHAQADEPLRLGVLAFGTVNWEVQTAQRRGLFDPTVKLDVRTLANPEAGKIGLQSGDTDIIVSDWIWVSRQRVLGRRYTFVPYSTTAGALVVPEHSPIENIGGLAGKRLGIAGGPLDKNWLLLKAVAQRDHALALERAVDKHFGAPPLLNQQLRQGRLDAVLTYWHYAAQLESQGYRILLDGGELVRRLGYTSRLPTLGYVFREDWARRHTAQLRAFLNGVRAARAVLCKDDQAWQAIAPLTHSRDANTLSLLRIRYCQGAIDHLDAQAQQEAAALYQLLGQLETDRTNTAAPLQPGTFWDGP